LTYDELLFVLGHELGHFRSRHVVYSQIAMVLPVLGDVLKTATLGIGGLLSGGLQLSVNNWLRMSDFTADRAGMLACQDLDAACRALIKLGGAVEAGHADFDVADFRAQAKDFAGYDFDALDKLARVVSAMRTEQPWTVMRASELINWIEGGKYDSLLKSLAVKASATVGETTQQMELAPGSERIEEVQDHRGQGTV
jgi:Zn-dependent protease with chaperone function